MSSNMEETTTKNHSEVLVNGTLSSFIKSQILSANACSMPRSVQRPDVNNPAVPQGDKQSTSTEMRNARTERHVTK